jgi:hypothetical protein
MEQAYQVGRRRVGHPWTARIPGRRRAIDQRTRGAPASQAGVGQARMADVEAAKGFCTGFLGGRR